MDKKIDDGDPATGFVLASNYGDGGDGVSGGIKAIPLANCVTSGKYKIDFSGYSCTLLIQIGGIASDPQ